ncbi:MAG: DUF2796 domain-containing protein [Rhodocyclaceae bacterium]
MKTRHLVFLLVLVSACAHAAKGHVHGAGTLDISIDKGHISLALELPLDAATGFEHAPKTPKDRAALEHAGNVLKDGATLFIPSPAAQCMLKSATVTLPFSADKRGAAGDDHADIEAEYTFECANPAELKAIDTPLFKHFKRLYRLEAQRVGPSGQGASRLTPKQPTLRW